MGSSWVLVSGSFGPRPLAFAGSGADLLQVDPMSYYGYPYVLGGCCGLG